MGRGRNIFREGEGEGRGESHFHKTYRRLNKKVEKTVKYKSKSSILEMHVLFTTVPFKALPDQEFMRYPSFYHCKILITNCVDLKGLVDFCLKNNERNCQN